ncbi:MAG: hypothetical protein ACK55Z_26810, partial [bacterium]
CMLFAFRIRVRVVEIAVVVVRKGTNEPSCTPKLLALRKRATVETHEKNRERDGASCTRARKQADAITPPLITTHMLPD